MKVFETIAELRAKLDAERAAGKTVGFVPTMGALHAGHGSLIERARDECDVVVVSIFVNPLQFGPSEDFDAYPRTWDADIALCEDLKADAVFHPGAVEMYPSGEPQVRVSAGTLGQPLCGRTRPGHFDGVATVVTKLFNAAGPCRAYFGRKDAQQLAVIRSLVRDLNLPVEVIGCPTLREADGLAISSRNRYLEPDDRRAATALHAALEEALMLVAAGERRPEKVAEAMAEKISSEPRARLDYAACVDAETLSDLDEIDRPVLLAVAAWLGQARLIDNETATPAGAAIREG
jgi:pantoate--beta-alanine ligase